MIEHSWAYCPVCCRPCVICGKCGNNACNGGYGTLPDGAVCDACPSAYETQAAASPESDDVRERG